MRGNIRVRLQYGGRKLAVGRMKNDMEDEGRMEEQTWLNSRKLDDLVR